jgi:hypothetical protein
VEEREKVPAAPALSNSRSGGILHILDGLELPTFATADQVPL